MKIAFHIPRMNWYRVLSPIIAESLRRGWNVECWHFNDVSGALKSNSPALDKVPSFKNSKNFKLVTYDNVEGLTTLLAGRRIDVVVDADLIPVPLPTLCEKINGKVPLTVLVESITNPRLQIGGIFSLPRFDLFSIPSKWYLETTVKQMARNHIFTIDQIEKELAGWGDKLVEGMRKSYVYKWGKDDICYYRENSVVIGVPPLDDLEMCDIASTKARFGISPKKLVVGYLPSPYDMPLGYLWGDLNFARNSVKVILTAAKYNKFTKVRELLTAKRDIHIVKAVREFCDRNNACLVVKLRHSRSAPDYLLKAADKVVGEDEYHPHTALQLFSISDLVFGFTTSAAFECVAAGIPYVDIELPYMPKKLYIENVIPALEVSNSFPGVIQTLEASDFVNNASGLSLKDFAINEQARSKYLNKFISGYDGCSSTKLLDAIERRIV